MLSRIESAFSARLASERRLRASEAAAAAVRGRRLPRAAHADRGHLGLRRAVRARGLGAEGGPRAADGRASAARPPGWSTWSPTSCCWPAWTRADPWSAVGRPGGPVRRGGAHRIDRGARVAGHLRGLPAHRGDGRRHQPAPGRRQPARATCGPTPRRARPARVRVDARRGRRGDHRGRQRPGHGSRARPSTSSSGSTGPTRPGRGPTAGPGSGLSIVSAIVAAHGGTVAATGRRRGRAPPSPCHLPDSTAPPRPPVRGPHGATGPDRPAQPTPSAPTGAGRDRRPTSGFSSQRTAGSHRNGRIRPASSRRHERHPPHPHRSTGTPTRAPTWRSWSPSTTRQRSWRPASPPCAPSSTRRSPSPPPSPSPTTPAPTTPGGSPPSWPPPSTAWRAIHLDGRAGAGPCGRPGRRSTASVVAYMDVDLATGLDALLPLVAPLLSGHSDVAIGTRLGPGCPRGAGRPARVHLPGLQPAAATGAPQPVHRCPVRLQGHAPRGGRSSCCPWSRTRSGSSTPRCWSPPSASACASTRCRSTGSTTPTPGSTSLHTALKDLRGVWRLLGPAARRRSPCPTGPADVRPSDASGAGAPRTGDPIASGVTGRGDRHRARPGRAVRPAGDRSGRPARHRGLRRRAAPVRRGRARSARVAYAALFAALEPGLGQLPGQRRGHRPVQPGQHGRPPGHGRHGPPRARPPPSDGSRPPPCSGSAWPSPPGHWPPPGPSA